MVRPELADKSGGPFALCDAAKFLNNDRCKMLNTPTCIYSHKL